MVLMWMEDVYKRQPLDRWYQIGNVITVVDASLEKTLSKEADYVLASEVANAGCVLLSLSLIHILPETASDH